MADIEPRREGESQIEYARRRAAALNVPTSIPKQSEPEYEKKKYNPEVIPQVELSSSPEREEMDAVIAGVDIVEAYIKWCGKMVPNASKRTESIMVSCPYPHHQDSNPSAWLGLKKGDGGVGNCAQCGGFDKYDIAAWHFGYAVPGYKSKEDFPRLREDMAESLGYVVVTSGKETWLEQGAPSPAPAAQIPQDEPNASDGATVGGEDTAKEDPSASAPSPPTVKNEPQTAIDEEIFDVALKTSEARFDWKDVSGIGQGTFLHNWMEQMCQMYEPEEFYFWNAIQSIGTAVGNNITLKEQRGARCNLLLCSVGRTSSGKTIALNRSRRLINEAFPYDETDGSGVKMVVSPGSGEFLVDQFNETSTDPTTQETTRLKVNGFYVESELATFTARARREGSTLRGVVMEMYDTSSTVSAGSRTAGTSKASDHFFQMASTTQPASLVKLMSRDDLGAGYLNRWFFAFGQAKETPAVLLGDEPDLTDRVDEIRSIRSWASKGRQITWDDADGLAAYNEFHARHLRAIELDEESSDMLGRVQLFVKKVLMLLAINEHSSCIRRHHVDGVEALWPYIVRCYSIVENSVQLADEPLQMCINAIGAHMRTKPDEWLTARRLKASSPARHSTDETIKRALELMASMGFIQVRQAKGRDLVPKYCWIPDESADPGLATVTAIK